MPVRRGREKTAAEGRGLLQTKEGCRGAEAAATREESTAQPGRLRSETTVDAKAAAPTDGDFQEKQHAGKFRRAARLTQQQPGRLHTQRREAARGLGRPEAVSVANNAQVRKACGLRQVSDELAKPHILEDVTCDTPCFVHPHAPSAQFARGVRSERGRRRKGLCSTHRLRGKHKQ